MSQIKVCPVRKGDPSVEPFYCRRLLPLLALVAIGFRPLLIALPPTLA